MTKRFTAIVCIAALLTASAGMAVAQNASAIAERRALLKQIGDAVGPLGRMLRREQAFDLAIVQASFGVLATNAARLPAAFPADSRTGDTKALPVIWDRKPEFEALFNRMSTQAAAARTRVTDEASFRAAAPQVLGVCGECHRSFRAAN